MPKAALNLCVAALLSLCGCLASVHASAGRVEPDAGLAARVAASELVLVARVEGPLDEHAEGAARLRREMHRVRVTRMLDGPDLTGWELYLRPPAQGPWAPGKSYVLFLTQPYFGSQQAVHLDTPALAATPAAVERTAAAVARRSGQVLRAPVFWLTVLPGWRPEPQLEVRVLADGSAWLRRREASGQTETRQVTLETETVDRLAAAARTLPETPVVDDATTLELGWTVGGEVQRKTVRGGDPAAVNAMVSRVTETILQADD